MGISVYWESDSKTILCMSLVSTWTWAEFDANIDRLLSMSRSVYHSVHLIVDIRYSAPQNQGPAWKSLSRALRLIPQNTGMIIVCGKGYFTTNFFFQLASTFRNVIPRLRHIMTLAEAHAVTAEWDTKNASYARSP
jgi:hypothetical protein